MAGRSHHASARRRASGHARKLAVYHASASAEPHIAELRCTKRFKLLCFPQRAGARMRAPTTAVDAVLWELRPGRKPNLRRLNSIARGRPLVSYSVDRGRQVSDQSRAFGFTSHLTAPLIPVEIEHQLVLAAPVDLATRFRQFQPTLRRYLNRVPVIGEMTRVVNASMDPDRVADALVARAAAWLPAPCWAVVGADPAGGVKLMSERGLVPSVEVATRALGAWVLRHSQEYTSANLQNDRRTPGGPAVAAVAFPLVCRGRTVAALVGVDRRPSAREPRISPSTLTVLRGLLEPAGIAIDNALRVQRAEALSVTDDLTQLYNSRYLSQVLRRETKRSARTGRPLSLLFIDLDGFKSINDLHGHLYGSRGLVEAAAVIQDSARETDIVSRFGGDEFALLLPDTAGDGARAVGERIREKIAEFVFLAADNLNVRLTASVGVATFPDVASTADSLLQAADDAMYWVKAHGKDGIQMASAA